MSKFLVGQIRNFTSTIPYLHTTTDSFIDAIQAVTLPADVRLAEFDIEDFFNQGSFVDHQACAFQHVADEELQAALQETLGLALRHQYAHDKFNDLHYGITSGSGQGLVLSGDLADVTFHRKVEIEMCSKERLESFGILFYARFRDNMFVAGATPSGIGQWWKQMCKVAAPTYNITFEGISASCKKFLDVECFKGVGYDQHGVISIRPHMKPRHDLRYLAADSSHHPHTHSSWPAAYIQRLRQMSQNSREFDLAHNQFLRCLASDYAVQPAPKATYHSIRPRNSNKSNQATETRGVHRPLWVTVPYHPALLKVALPKRLSELGERWSCELEHVFKTSSVTRIAWSRSGPSVSEIIRTDHQI